MSGTFCYPRTRARPCELLPRLLLHQKPGVKKTPSKTGLLGPDRSSQQSRGGGGARPKASRAGKHLSG